MVVRALLLILAALLLLNFAGWAVDMVGAIRYPFQLDYGEGIVWQQADMILRGDGYRPLSDESFIVFHYPPLYHLVSGLLARLPLGLDWLAAGRLVSALSTIGVAGIVSALAFRAARSRQARWIAAAIGGLTFLLVFALYPVAFWSALARVDVLAIFLSLLGAWFGLQVIERPRLITPAALCFVLAIFTRHTMISAPLATFLVLLVARPTFAWTGALTAAVFALAALAILSAFVPIAQFLQHIVGYNINRFAPANAGMLGHMILLHVVFFVVAYLSASRFVREAIAARTLSAIRANAVTDRFERVRLFAVIWFFLSALASLAVFKSGSYLNYLIEWTLSWALLIGLALRAPVAATSNPDRLRSAVLLAALAVQVGVLPWAPRPNPPIGAILANAGLRHQMQNVVQAVSESTKPVISSDMVAIKRAGKEVVFEPAIFAELTATGQWDPTGIARMISEKRFGLIITEDDRRHAPYLLHWSERAIKSMEQGGR